MNHLLTGGIEFLKKRCNRYCLLQIKTRIVLFSNISYIIRAYKPRYIPIKKSAAARLHTRNLGTSILLLENINTNTTVPLPNMASRNTIHTPHRSVHQSNKSWHGRNGPGQSSKNRYNVFIKFINYNYIPGNGRHWILPGGISLPRILGSSSAYSSTYAGKFAG